MSIRIIFPYKSTGFEADAKIFKKILEDLGIQYKLIISDSDKTVPTEHDKIHIYISSADKKWFTFTDVRIFMINHELFFQSEKHKEDYKFIDYVLCRTQIGYDWAMKIKLDNIFKYNIKLIKFTTVFPTIEMTKHNNLILHSAGEHHWKQTDSIIKAWQKYKDLPLLVVTCTDQCFRNVEPILKKQGYPKNIHFHKKLMDYDQFVAIKNKAGIHLCPSIVEGYGHYINEARKVKSLVITTNHPPMNELINDSCGILINCTSYGDKKNGTKLCFVTEDDIYEAVTKAINLPIAARNIMIDRAYSKYQEDELEFKTKMKEIINDVKST